MQESYSSNYLHTRRIHIHTRGKFEPRLSQALMFVTETRIRIEELARIRCHVILCRSQERNVCAQRMDGPNFMCIG